MESKIIQALKYRFVNIKTGDVFFDVDATHLSETSTIGKKTVFEVGRKYVTFYDGSRCFRNIDSNLIDYPKRPNYTTNRKHYLFASEEDARQWLDAAIAKKAVYETRRANMNEANDLFRSMASWSEDKFKAVIAAMKLE